MNGMHSVLTVTTLTLFAISSPADDRPGPSKAPAAGKKPADQTPKTAGEWVKRGTALFKRHRLDPAREAFGEALQLEPKNVRAYLGRARVWDYQRLWKKALADCEEALKLDPKSAEGLALRAAIRLGRNEEDDKNEGLDEVAADVEEALKLDPKLAYAHAVRAWYFNVKEKPALAEAAAEEALALDPELSGPRVTRSLILAERGEWDRAIALCGEAIWHDPYCYQAFNNRAWYRIEKKDLDKALEDASRSIELCPRNFWAYNNRAAAYRDKNDSSRALDDLSESMHLAPDKSTTYNIAAGIYLREKDYGHCIEFANKAIARNPKNAFAWNNRGAAYSWRNNYTQAVLDYSEAIRIKPDYAKAYQNRAKAYQSLGQRARADADLGLYAKYYQAPAVAEIPTGKKVTDRAAGFSVWLPGEYQKQQRSVQLSFAKMNVVIYGVLDSSSGCAVQSSLTDYPRDPKYKDTDRFTSAREGEIAQAGGKVISEKEITLGSYPGREYEIAVPGIGTLRSRIYLANQRIYVLKVLGPKPYTTSPVAEKFFESFKVLD